MSDDLQDLWQSQNPQPFHMSVEEIRERARKFQRRIHWRNLREYIGVAVVVLIFGSQTFARIDPIRRIGSGLLVAGALWIAWHLRAHGASREVAGDCLSFHRRELERQRDLLRSVWKWYLGPMIPGLLLIAVGSWSGNHAPYHTEFLILYVVVCALVFYAIGRLNERGARYLQRQIDELDRLR